MFPNSSQTYNFLYRTWLLSFKKFHKGKYKMYKWLKTWKCISVYSCKIPTVITITNFRSSLTRVVSVLKTHVIYPRTCHVAMRLKTNFLVIGYLSTVDIILIRFVDTNKQIFLFTLICSAFSYFLRSINCPNIYTNICT